jgi:hypothetical protein
MPTTAELLAQRERWLPAYWRAAQPITAGAAASMARASEAVDDLEGSVSIEGAEGIWLTLLARGYGVDRAPAEGDESLRGRLRNVEHKVTRASILARVNELLSEYTDEEADMIEHFDHGTYCDQDYADQTTLYDQHNAFTLVAPRVGEAEGWNDYADEAHADQSYAGGASAHPVYPAIMAEVERLRAAGVRWWLAIDHDDSEEEVAQPYYVTAGPFGDFPDRAQVAHPIRVPDGYRLTGVGVASSHAVVAGELEIVRWVDGVETDVFAAGPYDLAAFPADTDTDLSAELQPASSGDVDFTGAWVLVRALNLEFATTGSLAVALTFEPIS